MSEEQRWKLIESIIEAKGMYWSNDLTVEDVIARFPQYESITKEDKGGVKIDARQ